MSLLSGGGGGEGRYFMGEGHNFFLLSGGRSHFFSRFLDEGQNFFKSIFIEKIN